MAGRGVLGLVRSHHGVMPKIDPSVFVAEGAVVIACASTEYDPEHPDMWRADDWKREGQADA